jgi:hypothetical protein
MRGRVKVGFSMRQRGASTAIAALALLMLLPSQAGAVSFFRGDFPVGTQPTSVAVGDLNGGAPDLAVANQGSDDVSILLGDGFGRFTAAAPVAAGDAPSSVITGSFNGDAHADLAVASVGSDNISILLGNGAGGFTPAGAVSTGTNSDPRAIATGDFNNDAKPDLVSANEGADTVSVHLGDGMGAFADDLTPTDVSATSSLPAADPESIATVQLGGTTGSPDTNLDVLITSQTSDQLLDLSGDGTGEFPGRGTHYTPMTSMTNPNPSAVVVGALNPGSSNPESALEPDLLVANVGPDQVWPAFGNTNGSSFSFGSVRDTGAGSDPVGLALGDLDGDGDPDGITANSGTASATVIVSNGNGGTTLDTTTPVGASPRAVVTGLFDADVREDAVLANFDSNSVTALTSLPPGPPATAPQPPGKKKKKCKKKKGKKRSASGAKKKKKKCRKAKKKK